MRGPFPILSTPYNEDGSVDYESLKRGCVFTADGGCPGVIWCQSNDAVDLLTFEEKVKGYEACAEALAGRTDCVCCLGCNGKTWEQMVKEAKAVEEVAKKYPNTYIAIISRPPDTGKTLDDVRFYYEKLGEVAKRPVIIQTVVNETCPSPTVQMLIDLAKKWPKVFGYIKEESGGAKANERMKEENAAKPTIHTVFSAWGGWQWLHQSRRCGSEGLITERWATSGVRWRTAIRRAHSRRRTRCSVCSSTSGTIQAACAGILSTTSSARACSGRRFRASTSRPRRRSRALSRWATTRSGSLATSS